MYEHKCGAKLRKINREDLKDLFELKQESWWGTHKTSIVNMEDQERWYDSLSCDTLCMIVEWATVQSTPEHPIMTPLTLVPRASDPKIMVYWEPVGIAIYSEIDNTSRTGKISGSIYRKHRKTEIVTAAFSAGVDFAFEMLNLRRLESEVLDSNLPSQHLQVNQLEFKVEGRKRQAVYKCGMYSDSLILGLLRSEWESQARVKAYNGVCNNNFNKDLMGHMQKRSAKELCG